MMGSIADITDELAISLLTGIRKCKVDFVECPVSDNPASTHANVNSLLYGSALLSHDDGRLYADGRKRINFINFEAARIFGKTIEQMLGMPSDELAPNVDNVRQDREAYLQQSLKEPIKLQNLRRLQWQPDGSIREILISAEVFPYEHKGSVSNAASIRLLHDFST